MNKNIEMGANLEKMNEEGSRNRIYTYEWGGEEGGGGMNGNASVENDFLFSSVPLASLLGLLASGVVCSQSGTLLRAFHACRCFLQIHFYFFLTI